MTIECDYVSSGGRGSQAGRHGAVRRHRRRQGALPWRKTAQPFISYGKLQVGNNNFAETVCYEVLSSLPSHLTCLVDIIIPGEQTESRGE